MSVKHLTYLDIPAADRAEAAAKARTRMRSALADPTITAEQAKLIRIRLNMLAQWEAGSLPVNKE